MDMDGESTTMTEPDCYATDNAYLTTLAWCWNVRCNDTQVSELEQYWYTDAVGVAPISVQPAPKWTYQETLRQIEEAPTTDMVAYELLNRTSLVSFEDWALTYRTLGNFERSENRHSEYAIVVMVTGAAVPIVLSWLRFVPFPEAIMSKFNAVFVNPPLIGSRHQVPYLNLAIMPTRGQALFLSYIFVLNFVLCAVGYTTTQPNAWFASSNREMLTYISNRTGALSFANIPLLILYAGRNNFLLWLTNWSQSTFLLLHRWVAYLATLEAIIHSLIYLRIYISTGEHNTQAQLPYWYWGIIATLGLTILTPASMLPFRRKLYELFLASHFIIAVITLVGCYWHIYYLYQYQWGYENYVYVAFAVWAFERLVRLLRIGRYGLRWASVEILDDEYLKIRVAGVAANGHAYLYFPTLSWRIWENHPFSIAASSDPITSPSSTRTSTSNSIKGLEAGIAAPSKDATVATTVHHTATPTATRHAIGLTFFLRTHSGTTSLLRFQKRVPVLVETGYAPPHDYSGFEQVICIAGGVGVTSVIPILRANRERAKLYWTCRSDALVKAAEVMFEGVEKDIVVGRRHNIVDVVEKEFASGEGPIAVVVSGPAGMADAVRAAVAGVGRAGKRPIELFEESFEW